MSRSFLAPKKLTTVRRSEQMSIQKPQLSSLQIKDNSSLMNSQKQQDLNIVIGNSFANRVHCLVQNAVSVDKPTVIYKKTLPTTIGGIVPKKRILVFKQVDYIIANWTGTFFPNVLYICHKSDTTKIPGYETSTGTTSKRLAALELVEISPVLDDAQLRTYDLRYSLRDCVAWGVSTDVTDLELELFVDDEATPLELPLPNPLVLNFELKYERM